jgi:uncharacterized protein YndB with AHSA1/START domain
MTSDYEIVREFAASRERVYAAWTTPERFARWFGPRIFATPADRVVLDCRPGGRWQATLVGEDGYSLTLDGVYREVSPPERLVFTTGDPEAPGGAPASVVTVGFTDRGDVTVMTFRQRGVNAGASRAEQSRAGWLEFFERLDEQLSRP